MMFLIAILLMARAVDSCKIVKSGVSEEDKATILATHNKYRNYVASGQETQGGGLSKAANMMELVWDNKAASVAQAWADQCTYNHDPNLHGLGQNIGKGHASFESFINMLNDEVKNFQNGKGVLHLTQDIWATTEKVGCGFVAYEDENGHMTTLHVCNYSPPGNSPSSTMYTKGEPCSQCPDGTTCSKTYTSLCSR